MLDLLKEHPLQALRACFHFPDGQTDTRRASEFFKVSLRTVQHWLCTERMPDWAIKLLSIHYRGYLPDSPAWKDFYIIGDKMYFNGYRGVRCLQPSQMRALELALPDLTKTSGSRAEFWDKYLMKDTKKPAH